jgi:Flp pilus assembly pilin Flp
MGRQSWWGTWGGSQVGRLYRLGFWAIGRRRGLTSVEYALLLALVVVVSIGVWGALGGALKNVLTNVTNSFSTVPSY